MPIIYDKLFALLKERGITSYQVQKTNLLGRATEIAMKNYTSGPSHKVLCRLCEELDCQPGDLMEYVTDEELERRINGTKATSEEDQA